MKTYTVKNSILYVVENLENNYKCYTNICTIGKNGTIEAMFNSRKTNELIIVIRNYTNDYTVIFTEENRALYHVTLCKVSENLKSHI